MNGLWLERGDLRLRDDLPEPERRPGWSLVQVKCAGICATDQALAQGYMDFAGVPGHEFVGTAIDGPLLGRRVVGEINAGCGECAACRAGDSRHCGARTVLGIAGLQGAFAERVALPDHNLRAVPDGLEDDVAVFVEPFAAALHVADDVDLATHRRVLVAGDGKLGLLCAAALALCGCDVTLCGHHRQRADLLGLPLTFASGWLDREPGDFDPPPPFVVAEQRLIGSRCGRFDAALELLAEHRFDVRPLISARYPLAEGPAAFARAAAPGVLKVLLDFVP
jgi:threonine dehydrogenase-like Zn-dependent dehydrogenase